MFLQFTPSPMVLVAMTLYPSLEMFGRATWGSLWGCRWQGQYEFNVRCMTKEFVNVYDILTNWTIQRTMRASWNNNVHIHIAHQTKESFPHRHGEHLNKCLQTIVVVKHWNSSCMALPDSLPILLARPKNVQVRYPPNPWILCSSDAITTFPIGNRVLCTP